MAEDRERGEELAEITAENVTHAAKSLASIRGWIIFWSIIGLVWLVGGPLAVLDWLLKLPWNR